MKMKLFLSVRGGEVSSEPSKPPLDPPLAWAMKKTAMKTADPDFFYNPLYNVNRRKRKFNQSHMGESSKFPKS